MSAQHTKEQQGILIDTLRTAGALEFSPPDKYGDVEMYDHRDDQWTYFPRAQAERLRDWLIKVL